MVKQRYLEAVIEQKDRRVVDTPKRTIERLVPVEYRKGYRRVVRTPAMLKEDIRPAKVSSLSRSIEVKPVRFNIVNRRNGISYTFDSYEKFMAFVASLETSNQKE